MKTIVCFAIVYLLQFSLFQESLLKQIQGVWALGKDENVSFTIKGHKLIYPEDETILDFKLNDSIMQLSEKGHPVTKWKIIKVSADSLILKTEDSTLIKHLKIK